MLGQPGQEGDDVVARLALDGVDALQVVEREGGQRRRPAFADGRRGLAGIAPMRAMASAASASISNQMRKRFSGDQMAAIAGRV